jgi:metal transporter CNNM
MLTGCRYVLWLMYGLYPVAYPVSILLDVLLGTSHGTFFNRAGFKVLAALQERRGHTTAERLNREEVTVISSVLDLNETTVSAIMTPISTVFSLSLDADLNDATQNQILTAGFANIPVHRHEQPSTFVGVLSVKSLVAFDSQNDMAVGRMALGRLPVLPPDVSCQRTFGIFRDRKVEMALVTDRGTQHGQPLGIVTARDIMDELIGKQT